jgi:capsular polysaccharide biosynthesis protein
VSFAICFIKEYFDHRVTDPQVASQLLGVPTLGSIEKA